MTDRLLSPSRPTTPKVFVELGLGTHIASLITNYTYSRVWINRVRLPILLVVSWTGKNNIPLSAFAPENLVSRDGFRSPVPRQRVQYQCGSLPDIIVLTLRVCFYKRLRFIITWTRSQTQYWSAGITYCNWVILYLKKIWTHLNLPISQKV